MPFQLQLSIPPATAAQEELLRQALAREVQLPVSHLGPHRVLRRSLDARRKPVRVNLTLELYLDGESPLPEVTRLPDWPNVERAPEAIIVGAGPAGLFAALTLIESGIKPIVLERGRDVRGRRRDLARLNREHVVDPDSNYCFGEGGAGTYSDGKLYTRSKKRGDTRKVLEYLVGFGASPEILVEAHPHVGTNKLPGIIQAIRECILEQGGEVHFGKRVSDLVIREGVLTGVNCQDGSVYESRAVLLATGHSARDVFTLLQERGIALEAKPFALGVRVEHPQHLIDHIQYHLEPGKVRGPWLPAAPYQLNTQVGGRGVYSFCMCPGGIIAPCATSPGEVVTNGWSPSRRDQPWANSGIVVELRPEDWKAYAKAGPLAALQFQVEVEQRCWQAGGKTQKVPAQRLGDFVQGKASVDLGPSSYVPGTQVAPLHELLPDFISRRLREGLKHFGKTLRGFHTNEALVHAPESRTSSPVRIPRHPETLQHPDLKGLFPCGEGAGYAGGIVSAAIDGINSARALSNWMQPAATASRLSQ